MKSHRPHPYRRGTGDGLSQRVNGTRVRGGGQTPASRYGRQGQGQLQNPLNRHGSILQLADRELQRIPGLRLLPFTREFRGHDFQARPPHLPTSSHRQPHPRPRPPIYQFIKRDNYIMVGKVSERVLAREGECFWDAMRPRRVELRHACAAADTFFSAQASRGPTMA